MTKAVATAPGQTELPLLRTAEVLERTGISHQVLYRYVTLGLVEPVTVTSPLVPPEGTVNPLVPPEGTAGPLVPPKGTARPRLFHPNVVDLIQVVQSMTKSGYSLRDLKEIFFKDERVRRIAARGP